MYGILVCGDSISFGRGESPNIGWAGRLKKEFEPQGFHNCLYNLGVPGDTSTDLLKRFETEIKARIKYKREGDKFVILLAIGINDSRGKGKPTNLCTNSTKFKQNISKLIYISQKYTKDVVIIGLTPIDEEIAKRFEDTFFSNGKIKEYDLILKKLAKTKKISRVELFNKISKLKYQKLLSDGIHPNKKGYSKIYEIIKKELIKLNLIK